jgi:hypothetical protein
MYKIKLALLIGADIMFFISGTILLILVGPPSPPLSCIILTGSIVLIIGTIYAISIA